jgi:hypothetical protein
MQLMKLPCCFELLIKSLYNVIKPLSEVQAYNNNDKIVASIIPPLQGAALQYKSNLDNLLSFIHNQDYTYNQIYSKGELLALTPQHILQWMKKKACCVTDPALDVNPTLARASLLKYWKKALSFFMPNCLIVWMSDRNEGNWTRSIELNNSLIKRVCKKKVQCKGGTAALAFMTNAECQTMQNMFQTP